MTATGLLPRLSSAKRAEIPTPAGSLQIALTQIQREPALRIEVTSVGSPCGPVAQLAEQPIGQSGGWGSSPLRSTLSRLPCQPRLVPTVASHAGHMAPADIVRPTARKSWFLKCNENHVCTLRLQR